MPDPLQGVTLSQAAAEAAAIAPIARAMLDTLEFRRQGGTVAVRVVVDKQDLQATLEAGAALNGGEEVTFTAVGLRIVKPAENESGQSPTLQIEIDNVSAILIDLLDEELEAAQPIIVTHRVYASDDTSEPAVMPPLEMELRDSNVSETTVQLTCGFADPINEAFPSITYIRRQYPGLGAR